VMAWNKIAAAQFDTSTQSEQLDGLLPGSHCFSKRFLSLHVAVGP
jgi:hypothetical protein